MAVKKILFAQLLVLASHSLKANDTLVTTRLLERIYQLQAKESSVFPKGLIPSYRMYVLNKTREKADANIFFTALVDFTLKNLQPHFTASQQALSERIITESLPVYRKYKNPQPGKLTYNFWPKDTPRIFPNGGWMNLFDKQQALPDDMDDTVISFLALNAPDSAARRLHAYMQGFANNKTKRVNNTFPSYRHIGAYSTWFGIRMPIDFDVCVLSNILYFVQQYNLGWTAADSASLELIGKVITEKKHITHAMYVSPNYGRTPLILYHFARLMSAKPIPVLEALKPQLIDETRRALRNTNEFMDEVILSTALLKWGVMPETRLHANTDLTSLIERSNFSYFIASMSAFMPNSLKKWLGGAGIGKFDYHSEAYNHALVLEYIACFNSFVNQPR